MNKTAKCTAIGVAQCALFVALMTAGAYIQIPFPMVPLTFQTALCILCGLLLGSKKGILAMTAYALAGLTGLPVFSSGGGIYYVLKPSFGYILGFIVGAGVAGLFYGRVKKLWQYILLALAGFAASYAVGAAYFIAVWQLNGYSGLWQALVTYNFIYMPKDAVLAVIGAFIAFRVAPAVRRSELKRKSIT